jgi:hypothetical protein
LEPALDIALKRLGGEAEYSNERPVVLDHNAHRCEACQARALDLCIACRCARRMNRKKSGDDEWYQCAHGMTSIPAQALAF